MTDPAALFLMFESGASDAAEFYTATMPHSAITRIQRPQTDVPGTQAGAVQLVEMTICAVPAVLLNCGQPVAFNQTASLQVYTQDQAETDRLWNAIIDHGGAPIMCGWCTDKWGFHWQITPRVLMESMVDPDPAAAARVQAAMLGMQNIDIAAIEEARKGG